MEIFNTEYVYVCKKDRVKTRKACRRKKYIAQNVGADIYKRMQDLELKIKSADFWTPKRKYTQIKNMIKEYEQAQEEINAVRKKEREDQCYETLRWLRDNKKKQFIIQQRQKDEKYIMDLFVVNLQHLKRVNQGNLRNIFYCIKKSFYKQNVR